MIKLWLFLWGALMWITLSAQDLSKKIDIVKPYGLGERALPAERFAKKEFTPFRRFFFNTTTRYNYVFHSKILLEKIYRLAQDTFQDDYTRPLAFYNYDLRFTQTGLAPQLDSLLEKTTSGILLRDVRNHWAPQLYLYMGQAYYLKQAFDSALMIFQFIQYHYQEKKVRAAKAVTKGAFTSGDFKTRTSKHFFQKEGAGWWAHTIARNDALVWLVRTHIALGNNYDAQTLMETLRRDSYLPKRLIPFLNEVSAYYYYTTGDLGKAAQYMTGTLDLARDRKEKGRRCFQIAQWYQQIKRNDLATKFMGMAAKFSYDPVLEIHAKLNLFLQEQHPNVFIINDHIKELLRFSRQEHFKRYKDLIYYACAQMALKKNDLEEAMGFMRRSADYARAENSPRKNIIYLKMADMLWDKKSYYPAAKLIDSIRLPDTLLYERQEEIRIKQGYLKDFVRYYDSYILQDSLQRLASYSEPERRKVLEKIAEEKQNEIEIEIYRRRVMQSPGVGGYTETRSKWYFDDPKQIATGIKRFQEQWGIRKNADKWRLSARIDFSVSQERTQPEPSALDSLSALTKKEFEDKIAADIPLTPEQRKKSNLLSATALYHLGDIAYLYIKDGVLAEQYFLDILHSYKDFPEREAVFLRLYFVLQKQSSAHTAAKKAALKKQYLSEYPKGAYVALFQHKKAPLNQELEALYFQAYQEYRWRRFPKCMGYLERLTQKDLHKTYALKTDYMKAMYALARKDTQQAAVLLGGIVRQAAETEDTILAVRSKMYLEKIKQQAKAALLKP